MEKKWDKFEETLNKGAIAISSIAFVIMIVVIIANVITRYLFHSSLNWAEEIAYLCFNWAVFFGVAIVYRYQGLTAIDLVVERQSEAGGFNFWLFAGYPYKFWINCLGNPVFHCSMGTEKPGPENSVLLL